MKMNKEQKITFTEEMSELFSDIFKTPIRFVDISEKDFACDEDCGYCNSCDEFYKKCNTDFIPALRIEAKKIIINNPATIIFWADGTKTVVKCHNEDVFDAEKGIAMATLKKLCGNTSKFNIYLNNCLKDAIVRRA